MAGQNFNQGISGIRDGQSAPDWEVNQYGDARFNTLTLAGGGGSTGFILDNNEYLSGLNTSNVVKRLIGVNSSNVAALDPDALGVVLGSGTTASLTFGGSSVLTLDAANTLALKNDTSEQELRVYGSTTGPYYSFLSNNTVTAQIGNNNDIPLDFWVNAAARWRINASGANYTLTPFADNSADLGAVSSRIATGYFGTSIAIGTNPSSGSEGEAIRLPNNQAMYCRNAANSADISVISLDASDIIKIGNKQTSGIAIFGAETADVAAPAADVGVIYFRDNGGKTELVARFHTGAIQRLAIEP